MKNVFVLILGIASFSCGTGKQELKTDVEMKQVLLETSLGCAADSVACAHFEVNYPVFPGLDNAVQIKVQERLAASITSGEKEVVMSIEEEGKRFVDEYTAFKTETPDYTAGWYRQVDITLLSFSDSLLSLQLTDESYAGGAHGNYSLTFINLHPHTGNPFQLSEFLKPGFESELNKIGEEVFRLTRQMTDTATYEFNGYTFPEDRFSLNDNYGFSREGISFFFNSYEIAPYVMGPTEVLIPYDRIREWIK